MFCLLPSNNQIYYRKYDHEGHPEPSVYQDTKKLDTEPSYIQINVWLEHGLCGDIIVQYVG